MEESVRNKLKTGFTTARWGIDICFGALFIAIAIIVSAFMSSQLINVKVLMIPVIMVILGLIVFFVGRTTVGLQSRKLNLHASRPLTEEERWFVSCMLEMESTGAGVNFYNSVARMSPGSGDNLATGAMASAIVNKFFKIGKKYMGRNFLINRLPALVSLVIAIIIIAIAAI